MSLFIYMIPSTSVGSLSVNVLNKTLSWVATSALVTTQFRVEVASDPGFTDITSTIVTPNTFAVLPDADFFAVRYYRVTPFDSLGDDTMSGSVTHAYTPDAVAEFNADEVFSVPPPSSRGAAPAMTGLPTHLALLVTSKSLANYAANKALI